LANVRPRARRSSLSSQCTGFVSKTKSPRNGPPLRDSARHRGAGTGRETERALGPRWPESRRDTAGTQRLPRNAKRLTGKRDLP
jgi:hypothetical protein